MRINLKFLLNFSIEDFSMSDEAKFSERLIKSFEDGDEEMLLTTKNQPTVTNLDVEVNFYLNLFLTLILF